MLHTGLLTCGSYSSESRWRDLFSFCCVPSFFEDGPPPCSPSKVRWLKAYNKVRVQLLEVERLSVHWFLPAACLFVSVFLRCPSHTQPRNTHFPVSLTQRSSLFPPTGSVEFPVMPKRFATISCSLNISTLILNPLFYFFLKLGIHQVCRKAFSSVISRCGLKRL